MLPTARRRRLKLATLAVSRLANASFAPLAFLSGPAHLRQALSSPFARFLFSILGFEYVYIAGAEQSSDVQCGVVKHFFLRPADLACGTAGKMLVLRIKLGIGVEISGHRAGMAVSSIL